MLDLLPVTPDAAAGPTTEPQISPPSTAGLTTKVLKGSIWSVAGQVAPLAVSLVTVPFVIRMLGAEGYGVIVLVALIPGYLTFADLGMGYAATKFASEAYGDGNREKEARTVRSAALIALLSSLPFALVIFLFSSFWVEILNVPQHLSREASVAFKFAAIGFVANLLSSVINAPQLARLRMDLNMMVTAGSRIMGTFTVPLVIYLGGGISGAVFTLMTAAVVSLAGNIVVSARLNPNLIDVTIDRHGFGRLVQFGGALALSGIAAVILVNLEKLVLTTQSSVQDLAYYAVAFTFANAATLFSQAMGQSLVPAFAQLLRPDRRSELVNLFNRGLRWSIFGLLPVITVLFVIARPFFTLWAGEDFGRNSTWPFYVLVVGLFFNLNAYVPAALLLAGGRTDLFAKLYWVELLPYIAVTAWLTSRYGAVGAAMAWSLRVVIDAALFYALAKKAFKLRYEPSKYSPVLLGLLILLPPVGVTVFAGGAGIAASLLVISLCLYALLFWTMVARIEEKAWIRDRLARTI